MGLFERFQSRSEDLSRGACILLHRSTIATGLSDLVTHATRAVQNLLLYRTLALPDRELMLFVHALRNCGMLSGQSGKGAVPPWLPQGTDHRLVSHARPNYPPLNPTAYKCSAKLYEPSNPDCALLLAGQATRRPMPARRPPLRICGPAPTLEASTSHRAACHHIFRLAS
jgi:hypothetical protein